jgi:hypothetical protein
MYLSLKKKFEKVNIILLSLVVIFYPLNIYGIKPLQLFLNRDSTFFISFTHIVIICYLVLNFFFIKKKSFFLIVLSSIFILLPLITFNPYLDLFNQTSYQYWGSTSTLFYLILMSTFGIILFDRIRYSQIFFLLKVSFLIVLISSIFHILQFISFVIFDYKLYALFCDSISSICSDGYRYTSKYNYMGELMRSSGFNSSTNRSISYLIPGLYLAFLFFIKTKNNFYVYSYIIIEIAILTTLSRLTIFLSMLSLIFFAVIMYNEYYRMNIVKKIKLENFKFSIISILILIIFLPGVIHDKFDLLNPRTFIEYTRTFNNIFLAISVSLENFGLGVGYHMIDDYLFMNTEIDLWGSHSNLVQLIGGTGLIFISTLIYLLVKNISIFHSKKKTNLILTFLLISFVVIGTFKTYFINVYGIFFLSILLKICSQNKITISKNI